MEEFIVTNDVLSAQLKDSKQVVHSERKEKILRAVITWFTRDDRPEDREGLLEWFFTENIEESTKYQSNTKRQLQVIFPALFENHGDDSTFGDKKNQTPLHCCISKMNNQKHSKRVSNQYKSADHELVSALCNLGASIIAVDCDGRSPLGIALGKARMDLVRILIRSASVNVADRNILVQTVLHILIGNYDISDGDYQQYQGYVMEIFEKGADVNQRDRDGVTPVHLAAKKQDTKLLRKFKTKGADVTCRTYCGDDLLIIVCKSLTTPQGNEKALELINWLVDRQGFRANVKNNNGFTALQYAAKSEIIDIVRTVIRAGADIHAVANDNTNALHWAAVSSNFEVMQHLVNQNLDYRRRDKVYGFSLLHMATSSGEPRICEWLVKQKGFDVDDLGKWQLTPLHLASMLGNAKVVKKLIELDADVHLTDDKFHYSALHLASMRGRFATLRYIRANGHDEIKDDQSSMVDHCFNHHRLHDQYVDYEATIVALLGDGADVNARDNHGCTPLHYATRESVEGDIVGVLLRAGAHVDVQDNKCSTPLENCFVSNDLQGLRNVINDIAPSIAHLFDKIFRKAIHYSDSAAGTIIEHLLKLKTAGLLIDESYKRPLDNFGSDYLKKQSTYSSELAKMKKRMLTDKVSLYDVMHMSFKRRSSFANSLPCNIERGFPNYYVILKGRCNEAVNRMALLEPAIEAFERITGVYWPDICIDNILSFMSNLSLRGLVGAANVTESVIN